ncbi:MAG TPA: nitroreductase [Bacteroidales bacterium]
MELKEAILNRRTARKFNSKAVSEETLNEILEAGTWAPSHGNNQPWEFLLIGPETRRKLTESYRNFMEAGPLKNPALPEERKQAIRNFAQNFGDAPVLLAVTCVPAKTDLDKYDFPMSAAAAIQNILLAAWEKQIAGVWLSLGYTPNAQSILEIPADGKIAGVLALGYPELIPASQPRIKVNEKLRRLP